MASVVTLRWVGPHNRQSATGAEVTTEAVKDADALARRIRELDVVAREAGYSHTVDARHSESGHLLSLVVGADRSFLQFVRGDDPHSNPWESQGAGTDDELLTFFYESHHTEVPGSHLVAAEEAQAALSEFARTGELPSNLEWQRAW